MSQSILKVVGLIACAIGYHVSLTPPTTAVKHKDVYRGHFFDYAARYLALLHKTIACAFIICELVIVVAVSFADAVTDDRDITKALCPHTNNTTRARLLSIYPSFVAGVSLMIFSTYTRVLCYRTLDTMFTFELTIRPEHTLVTTGPYSLARHPSYTAAVGNMLAFLLTHLSTGSWPRECGTISLWWWRWAMVVYIIDVAYTVVCLWRRGPVEDARLHAHFRSKWEEYRKGVPWMYIPCVY